MSMENSENTPYCETVEFQESVRYAVIGDILQPSEIEHAKNLFWKFIQHVGGGEDDSDSDEDDDRILRHNPHTWKYWPGDHFTGIIGGGTFCHSEFLWYLREHPFVCQVFEQLWNTQDLLTSYDRGSTFRPWQQYDAAWKTQGGWWHIDQNSLKGPARTGLVSIQSLITMNDVTPLTGGFSALPGSHHHHEELSEQFAGHEAVKLDHVLLNPQMNAHTAQLPKHLIGAKAGDMILWDSRTVHCNVPALSSENPHVPVGELLRLVGYVCMQPQSAAPAGSALNKKLGLLCQVPTSHWAIEFINPQAIQTVLSSHNAEELFVMAGKIFNVCSDKKLRMCAFTETEIALGREDFRALWNALLQAFM